MTRVLLVDRSERGGIALYSDQLVAELVRAGADVALCAPPDRDGTAYHLARHRWGFEATDMSRARLWYHRLGEIPVSATAVARAIARFRPQVVHAQTEVLPRLDPALWRAVSRCAAVVLTAHDPRPHEGGEAALSRQARGWRSANGVIVHDAVARTLVEERAPDVAVRVIPWDVPLPPISVPRATARRELAIGDEPMAVALGLLRDYKGFDLLADAWPKVVAERADAKLAVVGDGDEDVEGLARLVSQPGVELRKAFLPAEDFDRWAAAADVLLMPYRQGSHSGVLPHALAAGTPVLSSPVLGEEVLRTGAGRVVERDPAAWSEAIADALWRSPLPPPVAHQQSETGIATLAFYDELCKGRRS